MAERLRHPLLWLVLLPTALAWLYWVRAFCKNWVRRGNPVSLFLAAAALGWVIEAVRDSGLVPETPLLKAAVQLVSLIVGALGALAIWQNEAQRGPYREKP